MSIWIEEDAKVLVQGITGKQGMFHADKMVEYGTNIVGGCTPGKGGQTVDLQGKPYPVWHSMTEAIDETGSCRCKLGFSGDTCRTICLEGTFGTDPDHCDGDTLIATV